MGIAMLFFVETNKKNRDSILSPGIGSILLDDDEPVIRHCISRQAQQHWIVTNQPDSNVPYPRVILRDSLSLSRAPKEDTVKKSVNGPPHIATFFLYCVTFLLVDGDIVDVAETEAA